MYAITVNSLIVTKTYTRNCVQTCIEKVADELLKNGELLTVLKERIAKRLAIIVLKPGARQDCAMKPSFNSARHMTSSPCFQSHDGMFSK